MIESHRHLEASRPAVSPKPEIWDLCKSLAEKHNLTPIQVLDRLVKVGAGVARVEEAGATVTAEAGTAKVEVKVFKKEVDGCKPQPPTP